MRLFGVVTALNEADTIGALVTSLLERCEKVIVINDGSADNTGILASRAGAHVINHYESQGIAVSLMEAWRVALNEGADRVLQIDAGGSHYPEEAWTLLRCDADIVIGSRFHKMAIYNGGMRKHFSRLFAALCNWSMARFITSDWTSGYRVFSRKAINYLLRPPEYWTNAHAWQAEIIHRAALRGLTIKEWPITYTAGRSSMRAHHFLDALLVISKIMHIK